MRRVPRRGHASRGRRDANEPEVIAALKAAGALVWPLDQPADLLVGFRKRFHVLEVKSEDGVIEDGQAVFLLLAEAAHLPVRVVRNASEALAAIGVEYDEAMDLAVYLRQAIFERDGR